jgi:hypothetical protein
MSWLGRYQNGQTLSLLVQTHDSTQKIVVPDRPPAAKVYFGASAVFSRLMPTEERYVVTGLFHLPIFLDANFVPGNYSITTYYSTGSGSYNGVQNDTFQVVGGGNVNGAIQGMYFLQRPQANFVIHGTETGLILKGRNPTIRN